MIRLCSIADIQRFTTPNSLNFAIVRYMTDNIPNVVQFNRLAPSDALFRWAKTNDMNDSSIMDKYHSAFKEELKMFEKQTGLAYISDLSKQNYDITLACYCSDYRKCHRLDVYEALVARGVACEIY